LKFFEKLLCGPTLACEKLLATLGNVRPNLRVLEVEVVLEFIDVHEAGQRDPVLLEDDVRLAEVDPLHDGAETVSRLGEGEMFNHRTQLRRFNGYQLLSTREE
jgi:hypothetical protein